MSSWLFSHPINHPIVTKGDESGGTFQPPMAETPMNTDPICSKEMDEATALQAEREGKIHYFCSEQCRQKFLSRPPSGIGGGSCCGSEPKRSTVSAEGRNAKKAEAHSHGHGHDQPAHHHSTDAVTPSTAAKYFCPMCAGVESDKPGGCPKCGMALERNPVEAGFGSYLYLAIAALTFAAWMRWGPEPRLA
jgi:YHS domain-containing protein